MEAYDFDPSSSGSTARGSYAVIADFADLDLRPSRVSNEAMGWLHLRGVAAEVLRDEQ